MCVCVCVCVSVTDIVTDRSRPRILHPLCTSTHDTVRPHIDKCSTAYEISYSNLIKIDTGPFIQEFSKHFIIIFLNARSETRHLTFVTIQCKRMLTDLVFLCETWHRPEGDEADCAVLTPPGFCLRSLSGWSGIDGGLAVLHRTSLTKNIAVSTRDLFLLLLRYVKCVFPMMAVLQRSLVFTVPPPSRQNKLTNAMFMEQCSDLLQSYVSCDRHFIVDDPNVLFDKPSIPSTSALNVELDHLSLHQLVKVPTHWRGHTLDWLITNRVTDVLDLTVVDMLMLLSDHFVIFF